MTNGSRTARYGAAAVILIAAALAVFFALRPASRPNVILISIDTLRPDRMGVYGHRPMGKSTTPFLEDLAAQGALFNNAVATTSWTLPAHYALLTGLPDQAHGVINDRVPPPAGLPMLAEILKDEGYATAGFYSGTYLHPLFGFDKGFDVYESCMPESSERGRPHEIPRGPGHDSGERGAPQTRFAAHELVSSDRVTEKAFEHLRTHAGRRPGQPFFLFLHYFDVHNDYLPPPPFDSAFGPPYEGWVNGRGVTSDERYSPDMDPEDLARLKALYDGEIAWVDDNIRRLFRGIATLDGDILENTLVIVTSDHGEEFFEHGRTGHRKNLFEYSVRIPLIMVCPGSIEEGIQIEERARIYDIVPTIIDLLGLESHHTFLGESLLSALSSGRDRSEILRPALLDLTGIPKEEAVTRRIGLSMGGFKLVTVQELKWSDQAPSFNGPVLEERHELYDLSSDPGEEKDLSAQRKDILQKMLRTKKELLERIEAFTSGMTGRAARRDKIPDHLKRSLEQLGYGGG